ncbi:hypothetical protein [Paenibacillus medicaginis]|uniref:Uncharacterized protein n=1 Tax=Paenibacillus medicaginis TaxID=1470560 RepID=A0ABV5BUV9_9BACL
MLEKTFKFSGYNSGDYESFCFAVSRDEFIRLTGHKPDSYCKNPFHKRRFNFYPNDLVEHLDGKLEYEFEITVKAKPIKK